MQVRDEKLWTIELGISYLVAWKLAWCSMDTLSLDVILYIYICMLCGIICNKLCNDAAKIFKKIGVKSQCI